MIVPRFFHLIIHAQLGACTHDDGGTRRSTSNSICESVTASVFQYLTIPIRSQSHSPFTCFRERSKLPMRIATLVFRSSAQAAVQSRRRPPVCRSGRTNALVYVGKVNSTLQASRCCHRYACSVPQPASEPNALPKSMLVGLSYPLYWLYPSFWKPAVPAVAAHLV